MTGKFIVFDVETVGLTGPAFAVGWGVLGEDLMPIEEGWASAGLSESLMWNASAPAEVREWLVANIPVEVQEARDHRGDHFGRALRGITKRHPGAILVADVPVPCEARFLRDYAIQAYPVLDVATALFMRGLDPIGTYSRLPDELPAHHPLHDARQSARIWREVLTGQIGRSPWTYGGAKLTDFPEYRVKAVEGHKAVARWYGAL